VVPRPYRVRKYTKKRSFIPLKRAISTLKKAQNPHFNHFLGTLGTHLTHQKDLTDKCKGTYTHCEGLYTDIGPTESANTRQNVNLTSKMGYLDPLKRLKNPILTTV